MTVDKNFFKTLWYENNAGDKFYPDFRECMRDIPEGFIYQHHIETTTVRHGILKIIQQKDVDQCQHNRIVPTDGWIEGIEGRECRDCYGTQTREVGKPWPEKWNGDRSVSLGAMNSSWNEKLVLAMATSGDYSLREAILIVSQCCERCLNVWCHVYGLDDGYPIDSPEYKRCNTSCEFCR